LTDISEYFKTLKDFPNLVLPEEIGNTYEENAFIKAKFVAKKTGLPAIGEDSGLEIDALKGELGVYSARFGGDIAYSEKILLVLEKMKNIPWEERKARFICKVVFYDPETMTKFTTEGIVEGYIAFAPCGENGFGYDPIFYYPPLDKTFGELKEEEKNKVSHRSKAFLDMKPFLEKFLKGEV